MHFLIKYVFPFEYDQFYGLFLIIFKFRGFSKCDFYSMSVDFFQIAIWMMYFLFFEHASRFQSQGVLPAGWFFSSVDLESTDVE